MRAVAVHAQAPIERAPLVLGERPPVAAQPSLAVYRAKTAFLNTVNRLLQRGSAAAERAVAVLWADA